MRKVINIMSLIILLVLFVNKSQAQNVNQKVKEAFHRKFPSVTNVHWGKENARQYEAEFQKDGHSVSANFTLNGQWVETETDIPINSLPYAIVKYLKKNYSHEKLGEIARTESPEMTVYEAGVEKGEQNITLIFNIDGKLISRNKGQDAD